MTLNVNTGGYTVMTMRLRKLTILIALLGTTALIFSGCSDDDDSPTSSQNEFPTVHGVTITPDAAIYADDTVKLTAVSTDPNDDSLRYTWSKENGTFDPVEAVGESINWTAPSTRGNYNVVVVGDDGNGGTSQIQTTLTVYGGDQSGTVDVVGGLRATPVGGNDNLGYVDAGDTIQIVWNGTSPIITDSTRPDETRYAPDGSRVDSSLNLVTSPQFGYADGLPERDAARYSVIGRIGDDGDWFVFSSQSDQDGDGINDTFTVAAPSRGKLYLSLNEQESLLVDNTGFWRFDFVINH